MKAAAEAMRRKGTTTRMTGSGGRRWREKKTHLLARWREQKKRNQTGRQEGGQQVTHVLGSALSRTMESPKLSPPPPSVPSPPTPGRAVETRAPKSLLSPPSPPDRLLELAVPRFPVSIQNKAMSTFYHPAAPSCRADRGVHIPRPFPPPQHHDLACGGGT